MRKKCLWKANLEKICTLLNRLNIVLFLFSYKGLLLGCGLVYQRLSDGLRRVAGRLTRRSFLGAVGLRFDIPNAANVVADGYLICS
jgi:hypothetical protein